MIKDHSLLRAKDWALLAGMITVGAFAWAIFAKIVLAQEKISDHEVRIQKLEPAMTEQQRIVAVQEAHFQDMIERLKRIESQTK